MAHRTALMMFLSLCSFGVQAERNCSDFTKNTVDLVFLFDGSTSLTTREFEMSKVFIEDFMLSRKNTSIKVAAVQFSHEMRTVFTFNDDTNNVSSSKLKKEPRLWGDTYTYEGLDFVLTNHLNNISSGASPEATKVLVLITDGEPTDRYRRATIKKYDSMNIVRFVIGVKRVDVTELRVFASEPKNNNTFIIENYNELTQSCQLSRILHLVTRPTLSLSVPEGGVSQVEARGLRVLVGSEFRVMCSIEPQCPGGFFELIGPSESHVQRATSDSALFLFSDAGPAHRGEYTCVFHQNIGNHDFSSRSQTLRLDLGARDSELIIRALCLLLLKLIYVPALYWYCKATRGRQRD